MNMIWNWFMVWLEREITTNNYPSVYVKGHKLSTDIVFFSFLGRGGVKALRKILSLIKSFIWSILKTKNARMKRAAIIIHAIYFYIILTSKS